MPTVKLDKLRKEIDDLLNPSRQTERGQPRFARMSWTSVQWRRNLMKRWADRKQESAAWRLRLARTMEELGVAQLAARAMCRRHGTDTVIPCAEAAPHNAFSEVTAYYAGGRLVAYRRGSRLHRV